MTLSELLVNVNVIFNASVSIWTALQQADPSNALAAPVPCEQKCP